MVETKQKGKCKECFWSSDIIGSVMVTCMWYHNEVYGESLGCSEWCSENPCF